MCVLRTYIKPSIFRNIFSKIKKSYQYFFNSWEILFKKNGQLLCALKTHISKILSRNCPNSLSIQFPFNGSPFPCYLVKDSVFSTGLRFYHTATTLSYKYRLRFFRAILGEQHSDRFIIQIELFKSQQIRLEKSQSVKLIEDDKVTRTDFFTRQRIILLQFGLWSFQSFVRVRKLIIGYIGFFFFFF